ncbi:unnamed protein product [Gongylonema pulchrum]|uniref:Sulfotransfer_1 domain-containing protein n=1 Tax=Gongylonema pulchrum TaxID=637853 RepID=A0A183DTU1_9BILA|nr:unnamed protein product [Gongylonema pulchrum]
MHDEVRRLYSTFLEPLAAAPVRVYFEKSPLLSFDNGLAGLVEEFYGDSKVHDFDLTLFDSEEDMNTKVIRAACFQASPDGRTIIKMMGKNMKNATGGAVGNIARRDIAPNWRTRFALATAFDSTFYWKPPSSVGETEAYFYETNIKDQATRSVVNLLHKITPLLAYLNTL